MKKFKLSTREIGTVHVFDLEGVPNLDELDEVAWKIQRNIRRHRLQRVILNLQRVPTIDQLCLRKLLAAFIRPQRSLIFGACGSIMHELDDAYIPKNMRICASEKEVAEDLGPFLLEKEDSKRVLSEGIESPKDSIGYQVERRRSKRMHVAIPLELKVVTSATGFILTNAIATNIAEGGLFAEYLDLQKAEQIDALATVEGLKCEIRIFPSANFPEEYQLKAAIGRKELRKKQLGLAVRFESGQEEPNF